MPCYHPLSAFQSRKVNSKGSYSISFKSDLIHAKHIQLPCGRCVGCRLERARQWAVRCMNEASLWRSNVFVTLTYADDALKFGGADHGILFPRDLTLFWKRLRKRTGKQFKYFACGEYGERSNRPHYHSVIFGLDFEDKIHTDTKNGCNYYSSRLLNAVWGHGDCVIGDVTFESCSYVARYVMKKHLGKDSNYYEEKGITPEFVVMSRGNAKTGPNGIAKDWYDRFERDVFPRDQVWSNGQVATPPRYYTERYKKSHPIEAEDMIARRVERAKENWYNSEAGRLATRERVKLSAIRNLRRNLD